MILSSWSSPVPPKTCMSICSSRHITKVLTWGSSPKRKMTGKHRARTVGEKEKKQEVLSEHKKFEKTVEIQSNSVSTSLLANTFQCHVTNRTHRWACLWRRAGSVQRRRWLRRGRKAADFQSDRRGRRSRSSHSTGRSRRVDCTRWSSYGPLTRRRRRIIRRLCKVKCFWR